MAAVILEDMVKRCSPKTTETQGAVISRLLTIIIGAISIALVLFARYFGTGMLSVSALLLCNYTKSLHQLN